MTNFVKKVDRVQWDRQDKALAKKPSMQVTLIAPTPEVQVGRQLQSSQFS